MSSPRSLHYDVTTNTSPASTTMDWNQVINFLKEYRILECSCCSAILGFRNRASGKLYCLDGCHERTSPPPMTHIPNPMGGAVIPPAGLMNGKASINMISNGLHGAVGGVPNGIVGYKQPPIMPIAARVPPTDEAVHPISAPKVVEDPPVEEKAKAQEAVPMSVKTAKVSSSVQQSVHVIEKVKVEPSQPQKLMSNVHVPLRKTNVFQASVDDPDAKIEEPKPVPPVIVIVEHNPNVALSRANIPWPEYRSSESLKCTVLFDCGDGGFFLQSSDPRVVESVNSVGERIVDFVRSGKCKSLAKPAVGALCLAPFEGVHYRAEIIAEEPRAARKWRTFFIDFGNTEILKAEDLLILPDELKKTPRLCAFGYWDQVLAGYKKPDELYNICEIETVPTLVTFMKKITDGQYVVQIGEAAKATFEVEMPVPVQVKPPPQWADCTFSPNLLSTNAVVQIIFGWDTLTYNLMADADGESVTKFQTFIAEYAKEAEPLTRSPCIGEIVIAPYDGVYYRGKVDKVEGDNCTCTFVDYGDWKVIKISDIKPVNDAIMEYPVYGMKVRLAKIEPPEGFTFDYQMEDLIYSMNYVLELEMKGEIKPADLPHFNANVWDLKKKKLLNDVIKEAIVKCQ